MILIVLLCDGKCHCKYGYNVVEKHFCDNQMNLASASFDQLMTRMKEEFVKKYIIMSI